VGTVLEGKVVKEQSPPSLRPFFVMEVLDYALHLEKEGRKVIHMEVGEPDLSPPLPIVRAVVSSLKKGKTRYTTSLGILPLREAIAHRYKEEGIEVLPEEILLSTGSSPLLFVALKGVLSPGGKVVITDPTYPCYRNLVLLSGGEPVFFPLSPEDGFSLSPSFLSFVKEVQPEVVLLNSPQNPTGGIYPLSLLREILPYTSYLLMDEAYRGVEYEGRSKSALSLSRSQVIVVDSFSKRYGMTGFRLGYLVAPLPLMERFRTIHQNLLISGSPFVQEGGLVAITSQEVMEKTRRWVEQLKKKRDYLFYGLKKIGVSVPVLPSGGFYLLGDFRYLGIPSKDLAFILLGEAGVATAPGADFGEVSEGFLRFTFARPISELREGMKRIKKFLYDRGFLGRGTPS